MTVTVQIPMPLRRYTGGASRVSVPAGTVGQVLTALSGQFPDLAARLAPAGDGLPMHLNVYVNGDDVRDGDGLSTTIGPDDEVILLPPAAGGAQDPPSAGRSPAPTRPAGRRTYPVPPLPSANAAGGAGKKPGADGAQPL